MLVRKVRVFTKDRTINTLPTTAVALMAANATVNIKGTMAEQAGAEEKFRYATVELFIITGSPGRFRVLSPQVVQGSNKYFFETL